MPLSEYEQRVLEQMEQQLSSDDPKLVNTFQGRGTTSLRRWILCGTGALAGLVVLLIGAVLALPWLGVLGFIGMFVSVVLAFSTPRKGPAGVVGDDGSIRPRSKSRQREPGFMDRMEQRWDNRRDGDQR
ncbi:DUF3040 domain-containing protein [Cellulomonas bogoriensis]|uniref:DUF3040 domain-containing protein n=1 Tax=Cellulomonas bogoriensis 69B4 = DSM 16987 TaxID=1386082 RepID=A0A0A0BVX4_9CELL|nr:DUF3040 domain-containing protein [Cellulomonas bogoriensis]KGM11284.1 hypothetical protein N869_03215 [Cellulomonas bogoriensis 69B4 = DSM 16987]